MATMDLGRVVGPQGPQGERGAAGDSLYQSAVAGGYTGTEAQFKAALAKIGGFATNSNPVFTGSISLGRKAGTSVGNNSYAVGVNVVASGSNGCHAEGNYTEATGHHGSHAEGSASVASGSASHAEGDTTLASGNFGSHAEGYKTTASGEMSHAEGRETVAEGGNGSHAEGCGTKATGQAAHAEGGYSVASAYRSHAEGSNTTADNQDSHAGGKYNKAMTTGGAETNQVGDVFVLGNGTSATARSNAFRVTYAGTVYGKGSFQTSGADYAEYFEWADENAQGQDRVGYFVTMEGAKIKLAQPGDYILGIVSANPCIIGNADEDWLGRQLHDQFGRFVKEYLETDETEVVIPDGLEGEELLDYLQENNIQERDGIYIQETTRVVDYETPSWRYKENPDYDPEQPYMERKDRAEWDAVGMLGVLAVRDDGTCQVNGFCQVAEGGTATAAEGYVPGMTWRVMERVNGGVVKVVLR